MIPASDWLRAAERDLPSTTDIDALLGSGAALVLAPHPDDESLGCGGLLAACAARGRAVRVVVISDGAGSHPGSRAWPKPRLAALRQVETRAAVAALGLDPLRDLRFVGLPDTAVPAEDAGAEAVIRDAALPGTTAVFATWRHDPHTDHTATYALAQRVAHALPGQPRLFAYPVWGWMYAYPIAGFPLPPEPRLPAPPHGLRLDVAAHLPAKRRAVAAHRSQLGLVIDDDPSGFVLPDAALDLAFRPVEIYLEEPPR